MALPPPQGSLCGVRDWVWVVVLVFLVVFVPLRSPSADEPPSLDTSWTEWTEWTDCPEARRWPVFCSALLNTTLLNDTARRAVRDMLPRAKAFFCDMVRVLNKMDCAQPFTVRPRWRLGCQEAYRDWSCSLLAEGLLPAGLNRCDSTCHQVIRVCPYLSPDRVQVEASGKPALHPSQYGGHPAFHCPTTYTDSNHHHTEDYFFRRATPADALVCILFNPSEAGLSPASFPLRSLDLRNFNFTYCQDYGANHDDEHPLLTDSRGRVNVSQCCWTYTTALPKTYNFLSSTLRRSDLEDKNCLPLETNLHEANPLLPPSADQETLKQVFLQCLVSQDTSSPTPARDPPDIYEDVPIYVDDPPGSGVPGTRPDEDDDPPGRRVPRTRPDEDDPPPGGFTSAEGEDYEEEDEEYDFPRATSTTEAFMSLIASLDSSHAQLTSSTTTSDWRHRRSVATESPRSTSSSIGGGCPKLLLLSVTLLLLPPLLFTSLEWAGFRESRRRSQRQRRPMSNQSLEWAEPRRVEPRRTQPVESNRPCNVVVSPPQGHVVKSHMTKSGVLKSHMTKSGVLKSHMAKSGVLKSHMTQSDVIKSRFVKSCVVKSHKVKTDVMKSLVKSHVKSHVTKSRVTKSQSQSPSTPSTTITTTTSTTSQGSSNEWRRLSPWRPSWRLSWSCARPCPRSYSLQRIS